MAEGHSGQAIGKLRTRAALISAWRATPDPAFRAAIERELYGVEDPERAAEEWERFAAFAGNSDVTLG